MKKIACRLLLLLILPLTLQGCIFVVGAAAGAAAIAIVYDHRTIKSTLNDTRLTNKIANRIRNVPQLKEECHIEVTVFNNVVLLTGQAPTESLRQQAGAIAKNTAVGVLSLSRHHLYWLNLNSRYPRSEQGLDP